MGARRIRSREPDQHGSMTAFLDVQECQRECLFLLLVLLEVFLHQDYNHNSQVQFLELDPSQVNHPSRHPYPNQHNFRMGYAYKGRGYPLLEWMDNQYGFILITPNSRLIFVKHATVQ